MLVVLHVKSVKYSFLVLSVLLKQCCTVPFITRKTSDSPWQVLCTHSLAIFFPWVECLAGCTLAFGRYEENMKPQTIIHPEAWDLKWMITNHSHGLLCFFPTRECRYFWWALYRHWNPTKKNWMCNQKMRIPFLFSKWSLHMIYHTVDGRNHQLIW